MLDSDDTTTVPRPDDNENQILFFNGSQRRGDFVDVKKPAKSPLNNQVADQFRKELGIICQSPVYIIHRAN